MIIDDYFTAIERGLRQNVRVGVIEEPITCLASDDHNGLLRCRVFFWDGSYLDIYEVVSNRTGVPSPSALRLYLRSPRAACAAL